MCHHEYSAGGVLYTTIRGQRLYVIVTERDGHNGLPKGHIESGETAKMTALREIREETGIRAALHADFITQEHYQLPHGGEKTVTYFLAVYRCQELKTNTGEVMGARLLPYEQAQQALTFNGARDVLRQAEEWLNART